MDVCLFRTLFVGLLNICFKTLKPEAISRNRANDLILLEATLMSRVSVPRPLMKRNTWLFTFAVQSGITFGGWFILPDGYHNIFPGLRYSRIGIFDITTPNKNKGRLESVRKYCWSNTIVVSRIACNWTPDHVQ